MYELTNFWKIIDVYYKGRELVSSTYRRVVCGVLVRCNMLSLGLCGVVFACNQLMVALSIASVCIISRFSSCSLVGRRWHSFVFMFERFLFCCACPGMFALWDYWLRKEDLLDEIAALRFATVLLRRFFALVQFILFS